MAAYIRHGLSRSDLLIAKFDADGDPSSSFGGGDGWRTGSVGPIDIVTSFAVTTGDRLIVSGYVLQDFFGDETSSLFMFATRSDGSRWRAFGDNGVVRTDFGLDRNVLAFDAAINETSIYLVGEPKNDLMVARFRLE